MLQRIIITLFPMLLFGVAYFFVIPAYERNHYNFTLESADGNITLKDFRGKAVAVYFGYTYCPDICPTTFANLTAALHQLEPKEAEQMQILFVSVDPDRDTPQSLQEYVQYFYPTNIGVTGTKAQIDAVVAKYEGTEYAILEDGSDAMGYTVGHTSYVYFFDTTGRFSSQLNHSTNPDETLKHMKKALHP